MSDPVVLLSTGDVVGPAGGVTDNSMVLFSGTSGKLIKGNNAVVTAAGLALLDDVNAAAQRVTLGLGNVDNTSDVNKPISTATQTALDLKANIDSPTFTGVPSAPTASPGTNTTQLANTAFVKTAIDNVNILKSIGIDQTWQDVTSSRTPGVVYTNTSGRPIFVKVTHGELGSYNKLYVDGLVVDESYLSNDLAKLYTTVGAIVPNGSNYKLLASGEPVEYVRWMELR